MTRAHATLAVRAALSSLFVIGYFVIVAVFLLDKVELDQDRKEVLMYLFGTLSNGVVLVMQFWIGSSQGSADKSANKGEV